jgi:NB-ARC domain
LDFLFHAFHAQNRSTEQDLPTRCAVHGMPGVGKTKLILQFCHIAFVQLLYSHILWMSATTTDKLIEGMTKILDLIGHPERTRSDQNAKLTAARLWLEDSSQNGGVRWLLVLDNVDRRTLDFLRENLPRRNGTGSIVFTSRTEDVAGALVDVAGGPHCKIELRVPDLLETTHLLFSSAGIDVANVTPDQKSQAQELVQAFGSLPLAVVQAASYMKQTATTLDDMLRLSKSEHKIDVCFRSHRSR